MRVREHGESDRIMIIICSVDFPNASERRGERERDREREF